MLLNFIVETVKKANKTLYELDKFNKIIVTPNSRLSETSDLNLKGSFECYLNKLNGVFSWLLSFLKW